MSHQLCNCGGVNQQTGSLEGRFLIENGERKWMQGCSQQLTNLEKVLYSWDEEDWLGSGLFFQKKMVPVQSVLPFFFL